MGSWGHLSHDQVHEVACFYAAAAVVTHGHRVKLVDEGRRYRLRMNGTLVQVPAQRAGAWQVSDVARPLADDTVKRVPQSGIFDPHRMRNSYWIDVPRLSQSPRS
jgi:hypothetical protein